MNIYQQMWRMRNNEDADGVISYDPNDTFPQDRFLGLGGHLQTPRTKYISTLPFTPQYVQSILTVSQAETLYQDRIRYRQILLDSDTRASASAAKRERDARKKKDARRNKSGVIGRKEVKEKGMWTLKKEETKFDVFVQLHYMWMDYMSELFSLQPAPASGAVDSRAIPSVSGMHAKLVKADFHGSFLTVRKSKNPALVGLAGIVIHESENTFRVITKQSKLKLIPKHGSVFACGVPLYSTHAQQPPPFESTPVPIPSTVLERPHIELELYGTQFQFRAADRAGRKFKTKETIEL